MAAKIFRHFRRVVLLILFGVFVLCIYFSAFVLRIENIINKKVLCYKAIELNGSSPTSIVYFEDILTAKKQPIPGKAIFFHETSCSETSIVKLNAK